MTEKQAAAALDRKPYIPVRVELDDGEKFVLAARGRFVLAPDRLFAAVSDDPFAPPTARRFRIIPLNRIHSVEDVDLRPPPKR